MSDDPAAALLAALAALRGPQPSAAQRHALAAVLRALAAREEQLASVQERADRQPPAQRPGAGPGAPAGQTVLIARQATGGELPKLFVQVGRAVLYRWQELHGAAPITRVAVRGEGGRLHLVAVAAPLGYALQVRAGRAPRFWADSARQILEPYDGHYAVEVQADRLII